MDDHGWSPAQGAATGGGEVVVGVLASPGAAAELAAGLLPQLDDRIAACLPGVRWVFRLVTERLVQRPAELNDLVTAARRRMLGDGWVRDRPPAADGPPARGRPRERHA